MAALNPIGAKALGSKLGSMQMLLLTAMTLLGFYLCFKELRRLTVEMSSLRDMCKGAAASALPEAGGVLPEAGGVLTEAGGVLTEAGGLPEAGGQKPVVVFDDVYDEDAMAVQDVMDEGLRQMLDHLRSAASGGSDGALPPADIHEVIEFTRDDLSAKTKTEIEELLREHGVPYKKSDPKSKLIDALLEATGSSTEGASTLEEAVLQHDC